MRNHRHWITLLLLVLTSSCASSRLQTWDADDVRGAPEKKLDVRWNAGQELHRLEVDGHTVLRATVTRVVNDARKLKVVVFFDLRNAMEEHVHFELSNARLHYHGEQFAAKDAELWRRDPNPDVAPLSNKKKSWAFELGLVAVPGTYDLVIEDLEIGDAHRGRHPLAREWRIPIKVPGLEPEVD